MKNLPEFLFAPTEPAAASVTTGAPDASTASAPAASATTQTPAASSTPSPTPTGDTGTSTAGTATTAAAPAAAPSWLDGFRKDGFTTTETDEAKVRQQLLQSHRDAERLRPLAPALTAYQQHAQQFHQWLGEQQKAAAKPANEDWTSKFWNPPASDFDALRRQVTTDAQGNVVAAPGAAPDAVVKFQAAQAFRQAEVEKLLSNPFKYMEPAIRHIAEEIASKQAQQGVGQYREQQEAQTFIQQHSDWLFDKDDKGSVKTQSVFNPATGRHDSQQVLSQWGQRFVGHLNEAAQGGMPPAMQEKYALQAIQNEYMSSPAYAASVIAKAQPPAVGTPREQGNAKFLATANPAAAPAATGGNAVTTPTKVNRNNLAEVMLKRFQDAGVSTTN